MSTPVIEVAQEALEEKIKALKIVDEKSNEEQKINKSNEDKAESEDEGDRPSRSERSRRPRLTDEERLRMIEEEKASKPVLETGVKGKVKWFSVLGRYGFIERDDEGKPDVFVHQTAIAKSETIKFYLRTLDDGEEVVFDILDGKKGPEAANVTGPEGVSVVGSKFARALRWVRRPRRSEKPARGEKHDDEVKERGERASGDTPRKRNRNRRSSRPEKSGGKDNQEKGDEAASGDDAHPKKEGGRRRFRNRNIRRSSRKEDNTQSDKSEKSDSNEVAGARRRVASHNEQTDIGRCGSALGGLAGLSGVAIDAQI